MLDGVIAMLAIGLLCIIPNFTTTTNNFTHKKKTVKNQESLSVEWQRTTTIIIKKIILTVAELFTESDSTMIITR